MSTDKSAEASWVGTGFALIAIGAVLAFTFTGDLLGIDVDVAGWFLISVGVITVIAAAVRRLRRSN
jgi:small basic protein